MLKIIKHYYVSQVTYDWVQTLADWDNITTGTYDLFVNLLTRSAWRYKIDKDCQTAQIMYPLPRIWLRKLKVNIKDIEHLVPCDNSYVIPAADRAGKCKYYWLKQDIINTFQSLAYAKLGKHCINLYTGKVARKGRQLPTDVKKVSLYDKNRNLKTSELIAKSINIVSQQKVKVNIGACREYTDMLNEWFERVHSGYNISNPTLKGKLVKNTRTALYLFAHFYKFRVAGKESEFVNYQPCFSVSTTGRISEKHLGLQGCSRTMRRKLLTGIECTNFDMQNSQLSCLHYLLPAGLIKEELSKKISRVYSDAESFGLPKKLVKPLIYTLVYNCGKIKGTKSYRAAKQYCKEKRILPYLEDYIAGLTPIFDATNLLLSLIIKNSSKRPWINLAGATLSSDELNALAKKKLNKHLRKGRRSLLMSFDSGAYIENCKRKTLLAFYIQGVEAYIIHTLTVASTKNDYNVISNQHDGIITTGNKNTVLTEMEKVNKDMNGSFVLLEKEL